MTWFKEEIRRFIEMPLKIKKIIKLTEMTISATQISLKDNYSYFWRSLTKMQLEYNSETILTIKPL